MARSLLALGREKGSAALLQSAAAGAPSAETAVLFEQAADVAGLPSAQAEIDRARLRPLTGKTVELREAPLKIPADARLSSGGPLRLEATPVIFYMSSAVCKTCSEDLGHAVAVGPGGTPVVIVSEGPEKDHAVRQVLQIYRYPGRWRWASAWPPRSPRAGHAPGGRPRRLGTVVVKPPYAAGLGAVVARPLRRTT